MSRVSSSSCVCILVLWFIPDTDLCETLILFHNFSSIFHYTTLCILCTLHFKVLIMCISFAFIILILFSIAFMNLFLLYSRISRRIALRIVLHSSSYSILCLSLFISLHFFKNNLVPCDIFECFFCTLPLVPK